MMNGVISEARRRGANGGQKRAGMKRRGAVNLKQYCRRIRRGDSSSDGVRIGSEQKQEDSEADGEKNGLAVSAE